MKALYKPSNQVAIGAAVLAILTFGLSHQAASAARPDSVVPNCEMSAVTDPIQRLGISWDLKPDPLTMEELDYLFNPKNPDSKQPDDLRLSYLTEQEMRDVEGRWGLPGAVIGGITAGSAYIGETIGAGEGTLRGFATTVALGAAVGSLLGPTGNLGAQAILGNQVGFYAGLAIGYAQRGCASCHSGKEFTHSAND